MLNKFHASLKSLNEIKHPASIFESTLIICTVLCIFFDLYQAFFGGQLIFGLVSAVSVSVGSAGLLRWITDAVIIYVCAYLIPGVLYLSAMFLINNPLLGIDPSPYYLNGLMSSISVIFPPLTAIAASIIIPPISGFLKWLELKFGSRHK